MSTIEQSYDPLKTLTDLRDELDEQSRQLAMDDTLDRVIAGAESELDEYSRHYAPLDTSHELPAPDHQELLTDGKDQAAREAGEVALSGEQIEPPKSIPLPEGPPTYNAWGVEGDTAGFDQ